MAKAMVIKKTHTTEQKTDRLIEVIKAKTDANHRLWKMYERMGDQYWERYYMAAWLELDSILLMLTHPDYFNEVCEIYLKENEVA